MFAINRKTGRPIVVAYYEVPVCVDSFDEHGEPQVRDDSELSEPVEFMDDSLKCCGYGDLKFVKTLPKGVKLEACWLSGAEVE